MDVNTTIKARMEKNGRNKIFACQHCEKMKRLINSNNKTLGRFEVNKSDPMEVIQSLVERLGVSVSKLSERKWDACFSSKETPLVRGNVEWWSELSIVNLGILKIMNAATVLLLAWETKH